MALAIVRCNTLLLRGPRDGESRLRGPAMGGWGRHGAAGAGETVGCRSPILPVSACSRAHA
eukprot:10539850-Ditylum_brightwellii.AAC.1